MRVLIADDNAVNRTVAAGIVEGFGHSFVLAGDGSEAVEAWAREKFDAVLMDVQMPGVDGFAATAQIRDLESRSGAHTPIIAMTAYAGENDRDRCLAAGMDDYVAKPIRKALLSEALARQTGTAPAVEEKQEPPPREPDFSIEGLLRAMDGNQPLVTRLVSRFGEHTPPLLEAIDTALAALDTSVVERTAHQLAGSLGNFAALRAARAARDLEIAAREGDLSKAVTLSKILHDEVDSVFSRLGNPDAVDELRPAAIRAR